MLYDHIINKKDELISRDIWSFQLKGLSLQHESSNTTCQTRQCNDC